MNVQCAGELTDIHKLQPNPRNPNKHPEKQIKLLAKIIDYQGQRSPIVVSKRSGFIVKGHGRLDAIKKLGWTSCAVDYQEYEDEAQEYADMIADNKIAELAEHDDSMMIEALKEIEIEDFDYLGIPDFEIPVEADPAKEDIEDDVPENVETRCKLGDLWMLGNHKLLCGDATDVLSVEKLMGGEKADITFTSPPYNAGDNIRGNFYENDKDNKPENEYVDFLLSTSELAMQFSKFVFWNIQILESNKYAVTDFQTKRRDQIKDILIWNKTQYPPHINKGTFGCKWEYVFVLANESKSRSFPCSWQGKFPNVIETENASQNEYAKTHKATFPVSFPTWVIEKMDFAKSVYDPFGGSGTTMIAAEKLGRKCFMMELDPHYCDVILSRWEKYSGKEANRVEENT